jgi:hypothetical protein
MAGLEFRRFSSLHLSSAGITEVYHHTWLKKFPNDEANTSF